MRLVRSFLENSKGGFADITRGLGSSREHMTLCCVQACDVYIVRHSVYPGYQMPFSMLI